MASELTKAWFRERFEQGLDMLAECVDIDPEVMSGQPCVVNTRFPVSRVLVEFADGWTIQEIADEYDMEVENLRGLLNGLALFISGTTKSGQMDELAKRKIEKVYGVYLEIAQEENGTFSAVALNLPGAGSHGDTEEEAVSNAKEAVRGVIKSYLDDDQPVPWRQLQFCGFARTRRYIQVVA